MPQLDFDGANSKISADKIQGQSGTTVTIPAGHNLAGDGSGLTSLSAANITSGGTLPALNGSALTNLPSHSGNVAFPATRVASADANTLDDYEEGTWTPILGGNATYNSNAGYYTKIGNLVTVFGDMWVNVLGTGGTLTGLPFTASNPHPTSIFAGQATYWNNLASACYSVLVYFNGSSVTFGVTVGSQIILNQTNALWANNTRLIFDGTYPTDS
jgi:hypothetical protein